LLPNRAKLVYGRPDLRIACVSASTSLVAAALCVAGPALADPSALPPELGYNYSHLETARTAAMGGALRAFSNSIEALQDNPANLAATRVYHMGALAQFWSGANRQSYAASIVDSIVSRSRMAGGISGHWLFQDPEGIERRAMDLRVGLGFPLSEKFLIGASARYLDLRQDGFPRGLEPEILPPSLASGGLRRKSVIQDITFDAGISVRPVPSVALSLVGYNLTDPGHGLLPLQFGGGLGYGNNLFTIEADLVGDFTTYEDTKLRGMGGLEYLAGGQYPLRVGYRYDQGQESHAISGGIGYVSREFSFDLALRRILGDNAATVFFFGLRYHVEALGIVGE
jgi:hypothetical protein